MTSSQEPSKQTPETANVPVDSSVPEPTDRDMELCVKQCGLEFQSDSKTVESIPDNAESTSTETSPQEMIRPRKNAISGFCVQHPEIAAIRYCDSCHAKMCPLCNFTFPGRLHVCPVCVANPITTVSTKRTVLAIFGLVAFGFSVIFLGAIMSGLMQPNEESAGIIFTALIFFPATIAVMLSYATIDRNRGNNALLWTSSILASLQIIIVFILIVYGNIKLMKG